MKSLKFMAIVVLSSLVMSFNTIAPITSIDDQALNDDWTSILVWKNEEIDLGNIVQGKPVTVEFEFTNKGSEAVVISKVTPSCGCTAADYTKKPIGKNEKATITVTYNAATPGAFQKSVTVSFGDNETKVLYIKGTVTTD